MIAPHPGLHHRTCSGFSLVSLLVSTAVGALVIAGALAALARARAIWSTASIENQLHERAQYAFASLETDLQMAGYFAGQVPARLPLASVPAAAAVCGAEMLSRLDVAVEAIDSTYTLRCAPHPPGAQPGTDVLILRRASARITATAAGRVQWLACVPGSCASQPLWDAKPPPGVSLAPPRVEMRELVVRIFYIARAADGDPETPALRVKSLSAVSGVPAFIDTEVMPGVEDLQIVLEPNAEAPHVVQVTLGLRADAADQPRGRPLRHFSVTRQFALRNVPPAAS